MIKKLIMIGGCIASFNLSAQCQINGEQNLAVGKEYTFSVDKKLAQCEDCHHWLVKKEDFKIISETKKNEIKIIPTKTGTYEISAAVIASNGLQNCQTTVNVHEYTEEKVQTKENRKTQGRYVSRPGPRHLRPRCHARLNSGAPRPGCASLLSGREFL